MSDINVAWNPDVLATLITEAVWETPVLSPHERLVMLCLLDHRDGYITYPPAERIAERTRLSTSTVYRVLKQLEGPLEMLEPVTEGRPWHVRKNTPCYRFRAPGEWA